jgi:D-alanine-D-alanine ligase
VSRIAVVCGGRSGEAEVSRRSGQAVAGALGERGHSCTVIEAGGDLWAELGAGGYEVAFLALHGRFGEDGTVQGVCELLGMPYTGSGVLASALCYDKVMTKRMLVASGIATAAWRVVTRGLDTTAAPTAMSEAVDELGLPMVVKPVGGGSTLGLTIARSLADLAVAYAAATTAGDALCESHIAGCEITVGILGDNPPTALPTLEIVSDRPLYDYAAKYTPGASHHIIPARLPSTQRDLSQAVALAAHRALGCRDVSRVDIIVDGAGVPWVLEVNSIPGLTELSLLPDAAAAAGIGFSDLCERLVGFAVQRGVEA